MSARRLAFGLALAAALPASLAAQRVVEVTVAPTFLRLVPGAQTMALATAYDTYGNPVDARIYWTSTNINVATVDSNGTVRAVAPGLAIITAATDTLGARRRTGRATVIVTGAMNLPGGSKQMVAPADTVAPPECADAEFGFRNAGRVCFDSPPSPVMSPVLIAPDDCRETTTPAVFLVHVDEEGRAGTFRVLSPSSCDRYQEYATMRIRAARFRPAHRNGMPVAAWTVLAYRTPTASPRIFVTPPAPMPMPIPPMTPSGPAPNKRGPRP